jgi:hypothetical protein
MIKCRFCENGTIEVTVTATGARVVHTPGGEAGEECLRKLHEAAFNKPVEETEP